MSAPRAKASRRCSFAGDVGQDAQLDLRVVGREQGHVGRAGDEGPADAPAELRTNWDVLKVRVGRRKPAGGSDRLVEGRVEPTVAVGDKERQSLDVSRPELRVEPPVEQLADHRMRRLELFEDRGVGRVAGLRPLALGQVQLVEEDLLELLGRAEIEVVSDVEVDLRLQARHLAAELDVEQSERLTVDGDAGGLHLGEDRDQRHLDLAEEAVETGLDQRLLERLPNGHRGQGVEADTDGRRHVSGGGSVTSSRSWATSAMV